MAIARYIVFFNYNFKTLYFDTFNNVSNAQVAIVTAADNKGFQRVSIKRSSALSSRTYLDAAGTKNKYRLQFYRGAAQSLETFEYDAVTDAMLKSYQYDYEEGAYGDTYATVSRAPITNRSCLATDGVTAVSCNLISLSEYEGAQGEFPPSEGEERVKQITAYRLSSDGTRRIVDSTTRYYYGNSSDRLTEIDLNGDETADTLDWDGDDAACGFECELNYIETQQGRLKTISRY